MTETITNLFNEPFFQEQTNRQLVYVLGIAAIAIIVLTGASLIDGRDNDA